MNATNEVRMEQDELNTGQQYLSFILDQRHYAVDILRVQEIKGWDRATPIPNTPPHIKGVINLRGTIVPIIDLRLRFGLEAVEYSKSTVVIVLRVESRSGSRTMGIVVDAVSDVHNVDDSAVSPAPEFSDEIDLSFIKGIASVGEKMIILLDVDHALRGENVGPELAAASAAV